MTVNAACKLCDVKYTIKVDKKPTIGEREITFNIERYSEHDANKHKESADKKIQVREDNRELLAKSVLINNKGSAKAYFDEQTGLGKKNIPSEDVIRKCLSELENKNMETTNWIANILHQSEFGKTVLNGKVIKGFVHELSLFSEFSMTLHMEEQLVALKQIPFDRRIIQGNITFFKSFIYYTFLLITF